MFTSNIGRASMAFIVMLAGVCLSAAAQDEVEHLKEQLKTERDTVKLRILTKLSREYVFVHPDNEKAKLYTDWAVAFADSIESGKLKAYALFYKAESIAGTDVRNSIRLLKRAEVITKSAGDVKGATDVLNNIGKKYIGLREYDSGFYYLEEGLTYARKGTNKQNLARALANLANAYLNADRMDECATYLSQAEALCKAIRFDGMLGFVIGLKARIKSREGDYKGALKESEVALDLYKKAQAPPHVVAGLLINMAIVHGNLGNKRGRLEYLMQAKAIREQFGDENDFGLLFQVASAYVDVADYEKALPLSDTLLAIAQRDSVDIAYCHGYAIKADVNRLTGNYIAAIDNYFKALRHADTDLYSEVAVAISSFYSMCGEDSVALHYAKVAQDSAKKSNMVIYQVKAVFNMAECHLKIKAYDSALLYAEKLLQVATSSALPQWTADANILIGKVHLEQNNLGEAERHLQVAHSTGTAFGNIQIVASASDLLGKLLLRLQQPGEAINMAKQAYRLGQESTSPETINSAAETLATAYALTGDYQRAYQFHKEFTTSKDSLFNISKAIELGRIESHNKLRQTRYENELLKKDGELKLATIEVQQNQLFGSIVGVVLLLMLAVLLWRLVRVTQRNSAQLALQNKVITDQNEELAAAMEKIKATQDQLIQSEKMASLGMLTAGIAHEINNPINFVSGGVQALDAVLDDLLVADLPARDRLISDAKELMLSVNNGVGRVAKIVSGLDVYSQRESDRGLQVNVNTVAEFSLGLVPDGYFEGIQLITKLNPVPAILGNENQISKVIFNLLTNAADAVRVTNRPGIVEISTDVDSDYVVLAVKDNGGGINDTIRQRIFDPFFTTKEVGEGVGLGLSVSLDIVKGHGGKLRFETSTEGTTFFALFPVHALREL